MKKGMLFHEVSESEKEEIRKEAKKIMDDFAKSLDKISDKIEEPLIERDECERKESSGGCLDLDRKIMLDNAPISDEDFIFAEKGGWRE